MDERQEIIGFAKGLLESYFCRGEVEYLISTFSEDVVWVGGGRHQTARGAAEVARWFRDGQKDVTPCDMVNEVYEYQKLSENCYLCEARSDLHTPPEAQVCLDIHQRCTFIFKRAEGRLQTVHIHNSMPYEALNEEELFPDQYGKERYRSLLRDYQRQKEKNLRDSELVYLAMKDTAICDYSYDPASRSIDIPDYMAERYGWQRHYDHMPESFGEAHIDEDTREAFCRMYYQVDSGEHFATCEFHVRGTDTWIRNSMSRVGKIVVGIVEDISLAKKTENVYSRMVNALGELYFSIYYVDRKLDYYRTLKMPEHGDGMAAYEGSYTKTTASYIEKFVYQRDREFLQVRLSLDYITSHLDRDNRTFAMEYRRASGEEFCWYRVQVILMSEEDAEETRYFILAFQNIDAERKEKELKDISLDLLRDAYYRIACVDLKDDTMTTIKLFYDEMQEFLGCAENYRTTIEYMSDAIVAPGDREDFARIMAPENLRRVFDGGARYVDIAYQRLIQGQYCWVRSELIPLEPYDREHARFMWYVKNISEEKAREAEFSQQLLASNASLELALQSEEQYRQAILSEVMAAYQVNITRNILEHEVVLQTDTRNIPFLPYVGMKAPCSFEVFRQRCSAFLTEDTREAYLAVSDCRTLLEAFEAGKRELTQEHKCRADFLGKGEIYIRETMLLTRSRPLGEIRGLCFAKDITAERRKENDTRLALQDAYEAANRASQAKSEFLSHMSHDIRTPMNGIIGMTAIAGTCLDDKERLRDCLNKITLSSRHLLALINDVLDMSKIESGKVDLAEEDLNLPDLIDTLLSVIRPSVREKGHELEVHIGQIRHEAIVGDSLRIQQVFVNIMSNAIKYTPKGGRIRLFVSEKDMGEEGRDRGRSPRVGCYEFVFEDNGIGMDEAFVKQIFQPFVRSENAEVKQIQGTGLGMAITRNIVRMMDGDIQVESAPGRGSRFTVTIYLKLQEKEEDLTEEFAGLSVLVADDDPDACESTCRLLEMMGIRAYGVEGGREALEAVKEARRKREPYFGAILDWRMPDMDGIRTAEAIRLAAGPDIRIIFLSSYDWSEVEGEARRAGADAFISKPLFKSRLVHLFRSLLQPDGGGTLGTMEAVNQYDFTGKRVLIAEDNELNMEIAAEILKTAGLMVEGAGDGREAVAMAEASEAGYYDLILMDIQMPVMNGYEAAAAIRRLPREDMRQIPVIAMSANAFAEDVQRSRASGMNDHIPKPLDFGQFMETLDHWLGNGNH